MLAHYGFLRFRALLGQVCASGAFELQNLVGHKKTPPARV